MTRPLLIDWYCCEGGAAQGYYEAGFNIIGIDSKPQPRYPFAFIQCADEDVDPRLIALADAHHASPPCQFGSELTPVEKRKNHVNRIPWIRKTLAATGKPYTIENVMGVAQAGHLVGWRSLTGTMFDDHMVTDAGRKYVLTRERAFETNWPWIRPWDPGPGDSPIANVYGGHLRCRDKEHRTGNGTGRTVDFPGEDRPALARQLMGMPWASMGGMSEAVPPSFTRCLGEQLMGVLRG